MLIKDTTFEYFSQNGAVNIELSQVDLEITFSFFTRCNNKLCGGAIRVSTTQGSCRIYRNCGTHCYTTESGSGKDFGQFICVNCENGNIEYDYLAASICCNTQIKRQIGPIGFIEKAKLICSHSNSSNNYCYFGPGFSSYLSSDVTLSYMNFANDTTSCVDRTDNFWIAVIFHEATNPGTVSKSNFFECRSFLATRTAPDGTFTGCYFSGCQNYSVSLLSSGNVEGSLSEFDFPLGCAAQEKTFTCKHNMRFLYLCINFISICS